MTNQTLQQDKEVQIENKMRTQRLDYPRKGTAGPVDVVLIGVEAIQTKRADIKTILPLKLARMAVTKIINETIGERVLMMD